jgi:hypothetical protein
MDQPQEGDRYISLERSVAAQRAVAADPDLENQAIEIEKKAFHFFCSHRLKSGSPVLCVIRGVVRGIGTLIARTVSKEHHQELVNDLAVTLVKAVVAETQHLEAEKAARAQSEGGIA